MSDRHAVFAWAEERKNRGRARGAERRGRVAGSAWLARFSRRVAAVVRRGRACRGHGVLHRAQLERARPLRKIRARRSAARHCGLAYWRLGPERATGKAALLVAAILLGVLLALFGQTYQTGADTWELFATWAALITPWVIVGRFAGLWMLWLALLNVAIVLYFWFFPDCSASYSAASISSGGSSCSTLSRLCAGNSRRAASIGWRNAGRRACWRS